MYYKHFPSLLMNKFCQSCYSCFDYVFSIFDELICIFEVSENFFVCVGRKEIQYDSKWKPKLPTNKSFPESKNASLISCGVNEIAIN